MKVTLRNGEVHHCGKAPRDKSASKAAKARRLAASQKGKTNVGNPISKGGNKKKGR